MLDILSISAVVAAAGVVVAALYAIMELRNLAKTRQTDMVWSLYSAAGTREIIEAGGKILGLEFKDYNDFVKKYGPPTSGQPIHITMLTVGNLYEGIGYLVYKKLVDIGWIDELFTGSIEVLWEKMKPILEGIRKDSNQPRVFGWFEYLYNELQKREQRLQQTQQ